MILIVLLSLLVTTVEQSKLNAPKVLLPVHSEQISNFTLTAVSGCLKWASHRPDIAAVTVHCPTTGDNSCCNSTAVVSAVTTLFKRQTSFITAIDDHLGHSVRCDVIVDRISHIQIRTTTKELYLEDSPEEIQVMAFDEENNTFSSLNGLTFRWKLLRDDLVDNSVDPHDVLKILSFTHSEYKTPAHIASLERQGKQGDRILVAGIQTGTAIVTVQLADPKYADVPPARVRLVVVANLLLTPPIVYLLPSCTAKFQVSSVKHSVPHKIDMPSRQYELNIKNTTVATYDQPTTTVQAAVLGQTEIELIDSTISIREHTQPITSLIVVVDAVDLEIKFQEPARQWGVSLNWILQTETTYECLFQLKDGNGNGIHWADELRITARFDHEYFTVLDSAVNGSWHLVRTKNLAGHAHVYGEFNQLVSADGSEIVLPKTVEAKSHVQIYEPVNVRPKLLAIPFVEQLETDHRFHAIATGGSGSYHWFVDNSSVCSVAPATGYLRPLAFGMANVTVRDKLNSALFDTFQVLVAVPAKVHYLPGVRESLIGSTLLLPLSVSVKTWQPIRDIDGKIVHPAGQLINSFDCLHIPLSHQLSSLDPNGYVRDDDAVFQRVPSEEIESSRLSRVHQVDKMACAVVALKADRLGSSQITTELESSSKQPFQYGASSASTTVASYRPLMLATSTGSSGGGGLVSSTPIVSRVLLGSDAVLRFVGGPLKWTLESNVFRPEVVGTDVGVLSAGLRRSSLRPVQEEFLKSRLNEMFGSNAEQTLVDYHEVAIRCPPDRASIYQLQLNVSNLPCASLPFPAVETIDVNVECVGVGRAEVVAVQRKVAELAGCPAYARADKTPAVLFLSRRYPIHVELNLFTTDGNKIDWHTNASPSWTLIDQPDNALTFPTLDNDGYDQLVSSVGRFGSVDQSSAAVVDGRQMVFNEPVDSLSFFVGKMFRVAASVGETDPLLRRLNYLARVSLNGNMAASKQVKFELVNDAHLNSSEMVLFNDARSKGAIQVVDGSGHVYPLNGDIVRTEVVHDSGETIVKLSPAGDGHGTVQLFDLCLDTTPSTSLSVRVSGVRAIGLDVGDRVKLGHEIGARVQLFDEAGHEFDTSQLPQLAFVTHYDGSYLQMTLKPKENGASCLYSVVGRKVGHVTVRVCTSLSAESPRLCTADRSIQVFDELALFPVDFCLVFGARVQLQTIGGPDSIGGIEFFVEGDAVQMSKNGLVSTEMLGSSLVTAKTSPRGRTAEGLDDPATFGLASSRICVTQAKGLQLRSPVKYLLVGNEVPVTAYFSADHPDNTGKEVLLSPFGFSHIISSLRFSWRLKKSSTADGVELLPANHAFGITTITEDDFSIRLRAISAGSYTVELRVVDESAGNQHHFVGGLRQLTAEYRVVVVELPAPFGLGRHCSAGYLLLAPSSRYRLALPGRRASARLGTENDSSCAIGLEGNELAANGPCSAMLYVESEMPELSAHLPALSRNITSAIAVKVKPIAYLMLQPVAQSETGRRTQRTGLTPAKHKRTYTVSFHDDLGQQFNSVDGFWPAEPNCNTTDGPVSFHLTRHDLFAGSVDRKQLGIGLRATEFGMVTLQARSCLVELMADFVNFRVDLSAWFAVTPLPAIPVEINRGEIISFCHVASTIDTSDRNVMHPVDGSSCVFLAQDTGTVQLNVPNEPLLPFLPVTVVGLNDVRLVVADSTVDLSTVGVSTTMAKEMRFLVDVRSTASTQLLAGSNVETNCDSNLDANALASLVTCDLHFARSAESEVEMLGTSLVRRVLAFESAFDAKTCSLMCVLSSNEAALVSDSRLAEAVSQLSGQLRFGASLLDVASSELNVKFVPSFYLSIDGTPTQLVSVPQVVGERYSVYMNSRDQFDGKVSLSIYATPELQGTVEITRISQTASCGQIAFRLDEVSRDEKRRTHALKVVAGGDSSSSSSSLSSSSSSSSSSAGRGSIVCDAVLRVASRLNSVQRYEVSITLRVFDDLFGVDGDFGGDLLRQRDNRLRSFLNEYVILLLAVFGTVAMMIFGFLKLRDFISDNHVQPGPPMHSHSLQSSSLNNSAGSQTSCPLPAGSPYSPYYNQAYHAVHPSMPYDPTGLGSGSANQSMFAPPHAACDSTPSLWSNAMNVSSAHRRRLSDQ